MIIHPAVILLFSGPRCVIIKIKNFVRSDKYLLKYFSEKNDKLRTLCKETMGKKVREAGMDWVPYVIVVGDEEVASKKLTVVTIRKKSQPNKPFKEQMTTEVLIAAVKKYVEGKPFRPLYTPRKLSMKARYI